MQPSYLSISLPISAVLRTISDLFELVPPGRSVPGVPRLAQHGAGSGWAVSVQLHASVTAKGSPGIPGGPWTSAWDLSLVLGTWFENMW